MASTFTATRLRQSNAVPSWQTKEATDWSNSEVLAFLDEVLPCHPCASIFAHTSGRVLRSLSKEDLRIKTRDEEAANIIWAELERLQETLRAHEEVASHGTEPYTIFVRTPADVSLELEVLPTDTVKQVKGRLASLEGTPVEMQRLTRNGGPMLDARTLASYNVAHGAVLLLVPRLALASNQRHAPPPASRSSHVAAANSGIPRPRVPLVATDIARPFPMSLEFEGIPEYQSFMLALQRQAGRRDSASSERVQDMESAPYFEILPADNSHSPVQTRIAFDAEAEVLLVDTVGDILMECTKYRVMLHLREEQKFATLVTGVQASGR